MSDPEISEKEIAEWERIKSIAIEMADIANMFEDGEISREDFVSGIARIHQNITAEDFKRLEILAELLNKGRKGTA